MPASAMIGRRQCAISSSMSIFVSSPRLVPIGAPSGMTAAAPVILQPLGERDVGQHVRQHDEALAREGSRSPSAFPVVRHQRLHVGDDFDLDEIAAARPPARCAMRTACSASRAPEVFGRSVTLGSRGCSRHAPTGRSTRRSATVIICEPLAASMADLVVTGELARVPVNRRLVPKRTPPGINARRSSINLHRRRTTARARC